MVGPVKRCVEMCNTGNAVTVLSDVSFLTDAEKAAAAAETAAAAEAAAAAAAAATAAGRSARAERQRDARAADATVAMGPNGVMSLALFFVGAAVALTC